MGFRAEFIKDTNFGLLPMFENIRDNPSPDNPIEINAVGVGLQIPANVQGAQLPAVFFGYGNSRRLEDTRFGGSEAEEFTVFITARINTTPSADLIDRQDAMRALIDRVRAEVRATIESSSPDEIVYVRNVVVSGANVNTDAVPEVAEMRFGMTYQYEYE